VKIGIQTWGSDGDIRPFIGLANGLARRGHCVSLVVASIDGKDYRSITDRTGVAIEHVPPARHTTEEITRLMERMLRARDFFTQLRIILGAFFDPLVGELYDRGRSLSTENDIVIGHFLLYPLHAAAEKVGKPYVTVTLNHMGIPTQYRSPIYLPSPGRWANPYLWNLGRLGANLFFKKCINQFRVREGLEPIRSVLDDVFFSRVLNLLPISSVFCPPMPDWENRHHVCGFFDVDDRDEVWHLPDDLRYFLDNGPPPVYFTLGSMLSVDPDPAKTTGLLVDAARQAGCRAIIQSRWAETDNVPQDRGIFPIEKAPHQRVFPYCAAVVHHGGAGTTHSATKAGCPSVVISHFLDQTLWGKELQCLSIAPAILDRRSVTVPKLARAIAVVLSSPEMKGRAEKMGLKMREEKGVEKAVQLIEQLDSVEKVL
jgi:sterol 3beta-glucosyltransferase